jgi:undecaprenyl-phosphate 4-deoxy-4-formamido-L-arabinose transferase
MNRPMSLSLVIPVYNEAPNLPELLRRCLAACDELKPFEIVLVDDGSRDGSEQIIVAAAQAHPGKIVAVCLNRNYGQHAAVMAGFAAAHGDAVVTLDADLQNPPEEIPRIVAKLREGFDVVGGVRARRRDSAFRRLASRFVNRLTARTTGVGMTDYGCMLRGYDRAVVAAMLQCRERSTFIPVLANAFAKHATEISVAHAARSRGRSKYGIWRLLNLQLDLLTATTKFPLRLLSWLGAAISVLGFGFGAMILVLRLIHGSAWAAEGVFTLFAVLFIILGAQFIGMGLLGEYLGRIYDDVRARPRYFVHRAVGRSELDPDAAPWTRDRSVGVGP